RCQTRAKGSDGAASSSPPATAFESAERPGYGPEAHRELERGGLPTRRHTCRGFDSTGPARAAPPAGDPGADDASQELGVTVSRRTTRVALSDRLTAARANAGQRFVAAPVFGRPEMAAAAKLFIVAAGAPDAIDACLPLFEAMGQKTFPIGDQPKAANLVKLSGNFLSASVIEALGEALALVGKAGVDRRRYLDLLTSTLFTAPLYKTYGGLIAEEKFEPAGFAAPLGHKDIRLTLAAADTLRVPMPFAAVLHGRFLTLLAHG